MGKKKKGGVFLYSLALAKQVIALRSSDLYGIIKIRNQRDLLVLLVKDYSFLVDVILFVASFYISQLIRPRIFNRTLFLIYNFKDRI